jgi:hypothetical protein
MNRALLRYLNRHIVSLCALALAACAAPNVSIVTPTAIVAPTLPPTWTPSPSATAAPPSATPTLPPTAAPTATLTADELCAGFTLLYEIPAGARFAADGVIPIAVTLEAAGPVVRFIAVQRGSGANQGVQLPGGQTAMLELPVSALPGPGWYDWTLGVAVTDDDTLLCARSGAFEVAARPTPLTDWLVPRRPTATPRPAAE